MFGIPGQGAHSQRIGPFALVDTAGTVLIAYAISRTLNTKFIPTLAITFVSAEIMHYLFCVDTAFMRMIS